MTLGRAPPPLGAAVAPARVAGPGLASGDEGRQTRARGGEGRLGREQGSAAPGVTAPLGAASPRRHAPLGPAAFRPAASDGSAGAADLKRVLVPAGPGHRRQQRRQQVLGGGAGLRTGPVPAAPGGAAAAASPACAPVRSGRCAGPSASVAAEPRRRRVGVGLAASRLSGCGRALVIPRAP